VLVGWLVSWLGSWLAGQRSMVERAVVIVSVLIALLQSAQSIALQQFLASRSTPGGYGVPVEMSIRLADEVTRASRAAHGAEALIYTEGDNRFVHEIPSVMDVLLPPDVPRRFVDLGQTTVVYPRDVAVVVVHSPQGLMLPDTLMKYVAQSQAEAVVAFRSGEADAQVRLWPGQQATTPPCADTSIGQWQNGVTLLTARLSGDWIELCYRVNVDRPGVDYHWFNHIIGPDGQRVAQIDGVGYPAASWRIGDVIMARFGPVQLPGDPSATRPCSCRRHCHCEPRVSGRGNPRTPAGVVFRPPALAGARRLLRFARNDMRGRSEARRETDSFHPVLIRGRGGTR